MIDNLWIRLNHLVPEPLCSTSKAGISKWRDSRQQPTEEELMAVDVEAILAALAFKESRPAIIAAITVEVNGRVFDGDEVAQSRMDRAVRAAQRRESPTVPLWVLSDNTVVTDLPVDDLEEALTLAVEAMGAAWVP